MPTGCPAQKNRPELEQIVVLVCRQCLRYTRAPLWQGYSRQCECGGQRRLLRFETAPIDDGGETQRAGG